VGGAAERVRAARRRRRRHYSATPSASVSAATSSAQSANDQSGVYSRVAEPGRSGAIRRTPALVIVSRATLADTRDPGVPWNERTGAPRGIAVLRVRERPAVGEGHLARPKSTCGAVACCWCDSWLRRKRYSRSRVGRRRAQRPQRSRSSAGFPASSVSRAPLASGPLPPRTSSRRSRRRSRGRRRPRVGDVLHDVRVVALREAVVGVIGQRQRGARRSSRVREVDARKALRQHAVDAEHGEFERGVLAARPCP